MPEYLHPGVYIEETSYRGKPIQGVATSTAGFVGRARKGPEGNATFVGSLNDFRRQFGELYGDTSESGSFLGHAVKAFFENGGSRAYVVRALASDARHSEATLGRGLVLRLADGAAARGPTRTFTLNSLRGVGAGTSLQIWRRNDASSAYALFQTVQVQAYDATRGQITVPQIQALAPGQTLEPEHTYFLVVGAAPQTGNVAGPAFRARSRGAGGDQVGIRVRPSDAPPVRLTSRTVLRDRPLLQTLTGNFVAGATQFTLSESAVSRVRTGDRLQIGNEEVQVAGISGATADVTPTRIAGTLATDFTGVVATLEERGGVAPPGTVELPADGPDLTGAGLADGVPVTGVPFPHDLAAYLLPGDLVQLDDGTNTVELEIGAVHLNAAANNVTTSALTAAQADPEVRLAATESAHPSSARVVAADVAGFAEPFRAGSAEPVAISNGGASDSASVLLVHGPSRTLLLSKAVPAAAGRFEDAVSTADWTLLERLQVAADGQTSFRVASTSSFYGGALVEFDDGTNKHTLTVQSVDPGARTVTTTTGLPLGANLFVDLAVDPTARRAYLRTLEIGIDVLESGVVRESFAGLAWNPNTGADSYLRYFVERVNDSETGSRLVEITASPGGSGLTDQPISERGEAQAFQNGSDGGSLTALDFIGRDDGPGQKTGIEALSERDDLAIVAVPGVTDEAVQAALVAHCERLKYRFAVLDAPLDRGTVTELRAHRNNYDSEYAAYYAPWLETLNLVTGRKMAVPPSGHVIGIYARSDRERGVHKAPANEVVRNVTDVEFPFTAAEQDVLNPVGINLIRDLDPRGIRVWGARTISSDQEWKYVNVRRLFIYLEHSIDLGTQWVVFEPNNESLWARVTETVTSFLTGVWKTGALMGTTPEQAFFVRCDRSTMTQDDLDNGRLICEIGVAPTFPAEFVIFRIGQFTASASGA